MFKAVILARVSDPKQMIKGDSLEDQLIKCNHFIQSKNWQKDREFTLIESGRKGERKYFWEIFEYCKSKKNTEGKIDYLVVLNIGRFTRGGGEEYLKLKREFGEINVEITDIYNTVGQKVNTLEEYNIKYDWSEYSPSEPAEVYEANQRRDYVRAQLTQMISGCIRNIRKGYWNGPAPFGLMNKKVETNDGLRNILAENPSESHFIKKLFSMRANGIPDNEIVKVVNSMGFKTRIVSKRDLRTKEKIGSRGGVPLTVKKVQEWVINPIYCGVIVAKWTQHQPVKATMFDGLVDVDTFNSANKGKVFVTKNDDGQIDVKHNIKIGNIGNGDKRLRYNPDYPFKSVLLCPVCNKEVKASASKSGGGKKVPVYFCDRKHKRWHKSKTEVHQTVTGFISNIKYSPKFTKLFEEIFLETWQEKRLDAVKDSETIEQHVAGLISKQKNILESIKSATSDLVRKALEMDYENIEQDIISARTERDSKVSKEIDVKQVLGYAKYLMEHPKELLIDTDNMLNQRHLFGLVFEELPTYDDLVNGTVKLNPLFQIKESANVSKSDLVQRVGVEPTLEGFTDLCLTVRLPLE